MKGFQELLDEFPEFKSIYDKGYYYFLEFHRDKQENNPYPEFDDDGDLNENHLFWERGYLEAWRADLVEDIEKLEEL